MSERGNASKSFLDQGQYCVKNILKYERIFGENFVSTGGLQTTQELCHILPLCSTARVLDIGSGSGGSALFMSRQYKCHVTGVDLSSNMTSLARQRQHQLPDEMRGRLKFIEADITQHEFENGEFTIAYSRDTLLHVADKKSLFSKILRWISASSEQQGEYKDGGHLVITDYCDGPNAQTPDYKNYIQQRGYQLLTVKQYGQLLKEAGFQNVIAVDRSAYFIEILRHELNNFQAQRAQVIKEFSEQDYTDIVHGWQSKIERVENRSQTWGLFQATTV